MAVKFECPKCGRKFAEWGAEKMGFHCPVDEFCPKDANEDIKFVKAGSAEGGKSPSLKRRKKVAVVAAPVEAVEEDVIVPDVEEIDEPDEDVEEDVEVEEEVVIAAKEPVVIVEDLEVVVADDEEVEEGEVADLDFEGEADATEEVEPEAAAEDEWA